MSSATADSPFCFSSSLPDLLLPTLPLTDWYQKRQSGASFHPPLIVKAILQAIGSDGSESQVDFRRAEDGVALIG